MAFADPSVMPNMPGLGEDAMGYGSINPSDPYIRALLRRQMMAQQLAGDDRQERMTHWLQPVAHAVNRGLNAWMAKDYDEKIRDYTRQQRDSADRAFQGLASNFRAPAPQTPAPQPQPAMAEGGGAPGSANAQDFIRRFAPYAIRAGKETGLDPRIPLAQAALETGWGAKAPGNNYFGIKGPGQTLNTAEVVNGQRVPMQDTFRAYETPEASFSDYAKFLRENPRYAPVLQAQGLENQIAALGKSGYATDPQYAQKLNMLVRGIQIPETPQAPVQVAQAPTGTITDAGTGGTVQVPGVGPMNREQIRQLTAMILMNPNLSADPRYARMAQGLNALAQSIPETKYQTTEIGGQVVAYNPANPQQRQVIGPATGHTPLPAPVVAQKRELGAPYPAVAASPERHQQDLARAGAGAQRTTINMGEKKASELVNKQWQEVVEPAAQAARARMPLYARAEAAIAKFSPGVLADKRLFGKQLLSELGIKADGVAAGEELRTVQRRWEMQITPRGQGQITEYERKLIREMGDIFFVTPQGAKTAIEIGRQLDQVDMDTARLYRENARRNGGSVNPLEISEELANYFEKNPLPDINAMRERFGGDRVMATTPPTAAIEFLRANPGEASAFDQKYGQGAAARVLGTP